MTRQHGKDRVPSCLHDREKREDYRQGVLFHVGVIVQSVMADDAEALGRLLTHANCLRDDLRGFFDQERWRPKPLLDGAKRHIPLGQPLTFDVRYHEVHNHNTDLLYGVVESIEGPRYSQGDHLHLTYIPARCRKPRHLSYHDQAGARLRVYQGYQSAGELKNAKPIFEHEHLSVQQPAQTPMLYTWTPELEGFLASLEAE